MIGFNKASQVLLVADVSKAQQYYKEKLGFSIHGQFVERDHVIF